MSFRRFTIEIGAASLGKRRSFYRGIKKIPRDLSGAELCKYLKMFGYEITRQTGSHIWLTTQTKGEHHITIPNHSPFKIGTLSSILLDIANHLELSKEELAEKIF